MRYTSKCYKLKLSKLHKIAVTNDMPLPFFIQLLDSVADTKKANRLRKRHGESLAWDQYKSTGFMVSVPMTTLNGKSLGLSCACFDMPSFNRLQEEYGVCPAETATQIVAVLESEEHI